MEQIGTVKSVIGNMAEVKVHRVSACGENCTHCKGGCMPTDMVAKAENRVSASVGDTVKMESDTGKVILAAFLLYIVPLLAAIVVSVVMSALGAKMGPLLIVTVNVFLGTILLIKGMDKKIAPTPVITSVIAEADRKGSVNV